MPDTYALVLPEKSLLDPTKVLDRVTADAKALGFTENGQAQKILDIAHREVAETLQVMAAANKPGGALYQTRVAEWEKAALAHKELGNGDKNALNLIAARTRVLVQEYGPEAAAILDETGYGSHPEIVLFLHRLTKAFAERPSPIPAKVPAGSRDSLAKQMYTPDMIGAQ